MNSYKIMADYEIISLYPFASSLEKNIAMWLYTITPVVCVLSYHGEKITTKCSSFYPLVYFYQGTEKFF